MAKTGKKRERQVEAILGEWGFETWRPRESRQFRKAEKGGTDVFGVFDIVATKSDEFQLVQVSSRDCPQEKDAAVRSFSLSVPNSVLTSHWVWRSNRKEPLWEVREFREGQLDQYFVDFEGEMLDA